MVARTETAPGLADGALIARNALREGMHVDARRSVSEWAAQDRVLTKKSSNEDGPWRNERTPYLVEIMDALGRDSGVKALVFMKGAQVGGTECLNNALGYGIVEDPGPMLFVLPTLELARRASKQRLDPLIEACPSLRRLVSVAKSRDAGNTILAKEFANGVLQLAGANSGAGLRSMPTRRVLLDEVDAFPEEIDGEGDPVELAQRGMRNYPDSWVAMVSTPTLEGRSRIAREFETTDRRYYHVPCPFCGVLQRIIWRPKREGEAGGIKWDKDEDGQLVGDPWMECASCEARIEEGHKTRMLADGEWIPENPRELERRGYHLSALYSPLGWFSWRDAVLQFLKAKGRQDKLRVWTNHTLGECWHERGEAPEWAPLYLRARDKGHEPGRIPMRGLLLTAGVDVQQDRLEVEVCAWGERRRSWSIAYEVLPGDTSAEQVWADLDVLLSTPWPHESGGVLTVRAVGIDSGYRTQTVYDYVRTRDRNRFFALKGTEGTGVLISTPRKVEVRGKNGRRYKRGIQLWRVGTDLAKGELYGFLRQSEPINPEVDGWPFGWCEFPNTYGEAYFMGLTAEHLVAVSKKGRQVYRWELRKLELRNEPLDLRVYNRAAHAIIGADRWREEQWANAAAQIGAPVPDAPQVQRRPVRRRRKRGGWITGRRSGRYSED